MPDLKSAEVIHFLLIVRGDQCGTRDKPGQETGRLGVPSGAEGKGGLGVWLGLEVELEMVMVVEMVVIALGMMLVFSMHISVTALCTALCTAL